MNIDIKKIAKTISRKNRGLQDPQLIYPARDWALGMVGTLLLIVLAVAFTTWQYHSYTNLSLDEEVVLAMVPYRTEQVEQALVRFRTLSLVHNEIISATSTVSVNEDAEEGNEDGGGVENRSMEDNQVEIEDINSDEMTIEEGSEIETEMEATISTPSLAN